MLQNDKIWTKFKVSIKLMEFSVQFKSNSNCDPDAVNVWVWSIFVYTYVPVVLSKLNLVVIPLTGLLPNSTLNEAK